MSEKYVDMHIHSKFSDGFLSVKELCKRAKRNNLKALVISDHDYCDSFDEIYREASKYGLETIPGIEISTQYNGLDIHLLVYGLNPNNELKTILRKIREDRFLRAKKIVENLRKIFNLNIHFEDVLKIKSENIGRPHIAKALIKCKEVKNLNEAFKKYLNDDGPAYVSKYNFEFEYAINLAKESGGITSLAHFGRYEDWEMLDNFCKVGLDAVEVYHPSHTLKLKLDLENYAKKRNLLITGGSDFHGGNSFIHDISSQKVPYKYFDNIKNVLN